MEGTRTNNDGSSLLGCKRVFFLGDVLLVILADDSMDLSDRKIVVYPHEHLIELRPFREVFSSPQRHSAHTT